MLGKNIVESKLATMGSYMDELMPFVEKYRRGEMALESSEVHIIERLFQLIADTAIDINTHVITRGALESPDDYEGTFRVVGKNKIIPLELAERISNSVSLRNRLVHGYETIQKKKMLDDISNGIGQYVEYMKHLSEYIETQK